MYWELNLGFYTGVLIGLYTQQFKDGVSHFIYLPFCFISLDLYNE